MSYSRLTRWGCDNCGRVAEREHGGLPHDPDGKWAFVPKLNGHACPACIPLLKEAGTPVPPPIPGVSYTKL